MIRSTSSKIKKINQYLLAFWIIQESFAVNDTIVNISKLNGNVNIVPRTLDVNFWC